MWTIYIGMTPQVISIIINGFTVQQSTVWPEILMANKFDELASKWNFKFDKMTYHLLLLMTYSILKSNINRYYFDCCEDRQSVKSIFPSIQ